MGATDSGTKRGGRRDEDQPLTTALFVAAIVLTLGPVAGAARTMAIPGVSEALDPTVTIGTVINIPGPPSTEAGGGSSPEGNSVESARAIMEARKGPGSYYEALRPGWLTVQHPNVSLPQIGQLIQDRYDSQIANRINAPPVTSIVVEPMTLIYPTGYYNNAQPVTVHARRLTLQSAGRHLVAYYLNYDKLDQHDGSVIFQSNGHFGYQPSRIGIGLKDNGGQMHAALGKIAMQGFPLITYDDHNVGESSNGVASSLPRTLENVVQMDQTLLVHFNRVDGLGLSGGCERLYHFMPLFESNVKSGYFAGYFNPIWTQYTSVHNPSVGYFGVNWDTYDETFASNFQNVDLSLVGLSRGVLSAFANATNESGIDKYGFFEEMVPAMLQYTDVFQIGGDDANGDGIPDYGPGLQHEYNLPELFEWLQHVRTIPEPATMFVLVGGGLCLFRRPRRRSR